ncbi:MAG: glycoside hydrolase family 5 protein [Oscillospiraceae bacterium]|nr:glycoside hydrolase family 5 protein [Oscillospiraceae bacterium]
MLKKLSLLLSCMLLISLAGCAEANQNPDSGTAETYLSAENQNQKQTQENALEAVYHMKIGWNLGDTLDVCAADRDGDGLVNEHPAEGEEVDETLWGNVMTTPELFEHLKADGINAVRIPVTWRDHLGEAPDYQINPEWLSRVHEVVDYALAQDMYVLLNIHHDGGGDPQFGAWIRNAASDYPGTAEKYTVLWTQIAESFADYPEKLIFESMNEVGFDHMAQPRAYEILNNLNQLFVKTVRKSNPDRNLLIAGYWTDVEQTCNNLFKMPEDSEKDRLIVSVHYYTPWQFCVSTQQKTWGSPGEVRVMQANIRKLKETFIDQNIPVIIGEYGTMKNNDTASRVYFCEMLTKECYEVGIPCYFWDNGEEYDRINFQWRTPGLIEALQHAVSGENYEVTKSD